MIHVIYRLFRLRLNEIALFLLLVICYTYFFPRWADPNQNSRLDMVVAVVEDGTFQIDKYVNNTVDYARIGNHYYSDKAPGAGLLGIPVYFVLKKTILDLPVVDQLMDKLASNPAFKATLRENGSGILKQKVRFAIAQVVITFFVSTIPTALTGLLLYRFLGYFTPDNRPRLAVVVGYGLLTPAFAYAGAFYGHQLSAALLFGAFYLIFRMRVQGQCTASSNRYSTHLKPILIGFMLGYSVVTEYPAALMVAILYLYTLYTFVKSSHYAPVLSNIFRLPPAVYYQTGWVTLAGAIVAAGWMSYNTAIFGGPLELGYSYSELWQNQHQTGFMSLTLPHREALWGITFGLFRGLFILSPWLLLAFPGFVLWWRQKHYRAEFWVALTGVLAIFLFNTSSSMWWGGFSIGPRYLLPMLPFMAIPVVLVFQHWLQPGWKQGWLFGLLIWSLGATWGMVLAEQAFPPDTIRNPWLEYAWPNWQTGNIARNVGTILGLSGLWSLLPLLLILVAGSAGWALLARLANRATEPAISSQTGFSRASSLEKTVRQL